MLVLPSGIGTRHRGVFGMTDDMGHIKCMRNRNVSRLTWCAIPVCLSPSQRARKGQSLPEAPSERAVRKVLPLLTRNMRTSLAVHVHPTVQARSTDKCMFFTRLTELLFDDS